MTPVHRAPRLRRFTQFLLAAALGALVAVPVAAQPADADAPPVGPELGAVSYVARLGDDGPYATEFDQDAFGGALAAGERLDLRVTALDADAVAPDLRVTASDGVALDLAPQVSPTLRRRSVRGLVVPTTGRVVVQVTGADTRYALKIRVKRRDVVRPAVPASAADDGLRWLCVGAVKGGRLDLSTRSGSIARVETASGSVVFDASESASGAVRRLRVDHVDETGDLRVAVRAAFTHREPSVVIRRTAPPRPRGTVRLEDEPWLLPVGDPVTVARGRSATLFGGGFHPAAWIEVYVGDRRAGVLDVRAFGSRCDVAIPNDCPDGPLDVVVRNADGQATAPRTLLFCDAPRRPRPWALVPSAVEAEVGGTQSFVVYLDAPAPKAGLDLELEVTNGVLTVPARVQVPDGASALRFECALGATPGTGVLRLRPVPLPGDTDDPDAAVRTLEATVNLLAPDATDPSGDDPDPDEPVVLPLDLSGWQVRQTGSARTFVVPPGTRVARGASVIVCRSASQTDFETFFGVTLPEGVTFVSGGGAFPTLNGDETFALHDANGSVFDGPTLRLPAGGGVVMRRVSRADGGFPRSWTVSTAARADAQPGTHEETALEVAGPFVAQVCDPPASGEFVYEFIEIAVGR